MALWNVNSVIHDKWRMNMHHEMVHEQYSFSEYIVYQEWWHNYSLFSHMVYLGRNHISISCHRNWIHSSCKVEIFIDFFLWYYFCFVWHSTIYKLCICLATYFSMGNFPQTSKKAVVAAFSRAGLGVWITKPMEEDNFSF